MKINKKKLVLMAVLVVAIVFGGILVLGTDENGGILSGINGEQVEESSEDKDKDTDDKDADSDKEGDEDQDDEGESVILNRDDVLDDENDSDSEDSENSDDEADEDPADKDAIDPDAASYEEWLSAGEVTAISISYPEFEIEEILVASETKLEESEDSKGVYVKFNAGGKSLIVHSTPLKKERTKSGTVDFYSRELGFATFDYVKADKVKEDFKALEMNQLNELISKSMQISLYEHF